MFNDLREKFIQDCRALDDKRKQQASEEEAKAKERENNIADINRRRRETVKDNVNKPLDQWVDSWEKYTKILEEFKKTG